jgi:hypothetical protein
LIARFNLECKIGARLIHEYFDLVPFMSNHIPQKGKDDYSSPLIELKIKGKGKVDGAEGGINDYLPGLRKKYWELLINDPRYVGQYTSNLVNDLHSKLQELAGYDFNRFNIDQLSRELSSRVTKGVEDAILKLFDKLSNKFAWDESIHQKNVHYYNGWKTNQCWKINKKVIVPMNGINASYSRGYQWEYRIHEELSDMVKVFNYLSPEKTDVQQLVGNTMNRAERDQIFTNIDFRYFEATFYKKRSCHIKFKDQDLLDKFNIFGSQRKGWLPPAYGKKQYEEMSTEERTIIDEFQGKEKYAEVISNPDYYLVDDAKGLLAEFSEPDANHG